MEGDSLEQLESLKAERDRLEPGNRSGGNPNKNVAHIHQLNRKIAAMTDRLKEAGILPYSAEEVLKNTLDMATPGRRKGCCVAFEGQWYVVRYTHRDPDKFPAWQHVWDKIEPDEAHRAGRYVFGQGPSIS